MYLQVHNCTYDRPLRKIHGRGPRCPEVRPRPPPMNEDGRRTAPMTMRDEPASGPAEAGGLDKLNGGRMLQEQLKRVRQRVVHRDGTPFKRRRTILADNSDDGTGLLSDAQMIENRRDTVKIKRWRPSSTRKTLGKAKY